MNNNSKKHSKVLIIGSGPAGYTAAVYPAGPDPIIKTFECFFELVFIFNAHIGIFFKI